MRALHLKPAPLALAFAVFAFWPMAADTVLLKDGSVVEGDVLSQTRREIRIKTSSGHRVVLKSDIRRILYANSPGRPSKSGPKGAGHGPREVAPAKKEGKGGEGTPVIRIFLGLTSAPAAKAGTS